MEMSALNATSPDSIDFELNKGTLKCKVSLSTVALVATMATMSTGPVLDSTERMFYTQLPFCTVVQSGVDAIETIPYADKIQCVLDFYALGKTHLCKIVNVTRPALYAWIDGSSEPSIENFKKIDSLYAIAKRLMKKSENTLYRGFVERPFGHYNESLFENLSNNNDLNGENLFRQISDAYELSLKRKKNISSRRERSFEMPHSVEEEKLNLEANL